MKKLINILCFLFSLYCVAWAGDVGLVIDSPANGFTVKQSQMEIKGVVKNADDLLVNGIAVKFAPNGRFIYPVTLSEGVNAFKIEALNKESLDVITQQIKGEYIKTVKPEVQAKSKSSITYKLLFPLKEKDINTTKDKVLIKAAVTGAKKAYINGNPVNIVRGRIFSKVPLLKIGRTDIKIVLTNGSDILRKTITVHRKKDLDDLSDSSINYKILYPTDGLVTDESFVLVKASVSGADKVYVNGRFIRINRDRIYTKVKLTKPGKNIIEFVFVNKAEKVPVSVVVIREVEQKVDSISRAPESEVIETVVPEQIEQPVVVESIKDEVQEQPVEDKKEPIAQSVEPTIEYQQVDKEDVIASVKEEIKDDISLNQKKIKTELKSEFSDEIRQLVIENVPSGLSSKEKDEIVERVSLSLQEDLKEMSAQERIALQDNLNDEIDAQVKEQVGERMNKVEIRLASLMKKLEEEKKRKAKVKPKVDKSNELSAKASKKISITLKNANIRDVIQLLSKKANINIIADQTLSGKVSVDLKDVELFTALNLVLKTHGYSYTLVDNTLVIGDEKKLSAATNLEVRVFRLSQAKVKSIEKVVESFLRPGEKVTIAEEENSIVVNASLVTLKKIESTIKELDQNLTKQVFIEAKIVEVGTNVLEKIGVEWDGKTLVALQSADGDGESSSAEGSTTYISGPMKAALSKPEFILNYLNEHGDAKTLATPKMSAVNAKEAHIHVGDRYPYVITKINSQTGEKETEVKFIDTGIKLDITPFINNMDGTVKLIVKTEVSFIFGFAGTNNEVPWVRTREAETTIKIKDGETIIIGGLINNEKTTSKKRIPFFSDIPLIGDFFTNYQEENKETELLIAITPKVM